MEYVTHVLKNIEMEVKKMKENKPSVGGQAVIEGVMMRNDDLYAVAVRKPDKEIIVEEMNHKSFTKT